MFIKPTLHYGAGAGGGVSIDTTNLISWWSLDEASGTRADAHTNSYDLDAVTTAGSATGKVGNAADCDGSSTYLRTSQTAAWQFTGEFYVCGWVNLDTSHTGTVVAKRSFGVETGGWHIGASSAVGYIEFSYYDGTFITGVPVNLAVSTGTWYFFEGGYDATVGEAFAVVNRGTPELTTGANAPVAGTARGLSIGGYSAGSTLLNGKVDEVGIFSVIPSDEERDAIYNAGNGISYPG